jgi:hypothetical protein
MKGRRKVSVAVREGHWFYEHGAKTQRHTFLFYRKGNIFFTISCPMPGTFIIELHYKGRDKPILEMDLKLDDLLEKVSKKIKRVEGGVGE